MGRSSSPMPSTAGPLAHQGDDGLAPVARPVPGEHGLVLDVGVAAEGVVARHVGPGEYAHQPRVAAL